MTAEVEVGWFTYTIRKEKPLGARFAAYRLCLRLPSLLRLYFSTSIAAVAQAMRHIRDGKGHGRNPG